MAAFWFLLVGVLLVVIALLARFLDRLPVSPAMIYLFVGFALGPAAFDVLEIHPLRELALLEAISEIALLIALFTVGIKMRVPLGDWRWSLPLKLATISMVLTTAGVAAAGYWLLVLPAGLALVLGATLAPTDPVLASNVQLRSPNDRDTLRFALTGEGGLNDGTAFPFVLLGLGWLGLHELGEYGARWLLVDVIWGTAGGLGIGFAIGAGVARGVRALRSWREDAAIIDEFLLLGVIGLSYGAALAAHTLGFLAVFAAGLALRRGDDLHAGSRPVAHRSPLTPSMLSVNEQLERIVEVADAAPRRLLAWFGIRGVGSVYYATYASAHGIPLAPAIDLVSCVFTVIAASIVVHGVSATPLMALYRRGSRGGGTPRPLSDKR